MTRLKQAHDRNARVRCIQESLETFVVEYAAQSSERPSLVIQTLLRYAFEALVVQTGDFATARVITQGIVEIGYLKHKYKSD